MVPGAPSPDHQVTEDPSHRDDVLNDLTIIQAQAQLLMRRMQRAGYVDHDDAHQRLTEVVEAVRRVTRLYR